MIPPDWPPLLGLTEIARILGCPVGTVRVWHHRGKLPPPTACLAMGPVWRAEDIAPWLKVVLASAERRPPAHKRGPKPGGPRRVDRLPD